MNTEHTKYLLSFLTPPESHTDYESLLIEEKKLYVFHIIMKDKNKKNHTIFQLSKTFEDAVDALSDYIFLADIDILDIDFYNTVLVPSEKLLIESLKKTVVLGTDK
jgi:hypothetical protein